MSNTTIDDIKVIENPNSREPQQEGEKYFKEKICSSNLFKGWTLYEQPIINSMHPDFILTHPKKGLIIVEVKDWHLNLPSYKPIGQVLGSNGKYINKNPIKQIQKYKDMILQYELNQFLDVIKNHSNESYAIITNLVYFHNANRAVAFEFCGNPLNKRCLVWTKRELDYLCDNSNPLQDEINFPAFPFFKESKFSKNPANLLQELVKELDHSLRPSDYARERKDVIGLTTEQKKLVELKSGQIRRWSGVAGSGKTLILATKATEAIKNNQRVLILSYNITLRHYIRDLCSQQHGQQNRKLLKTNLTIAHFHGFLKILLAELNIDLNEEKFNINEYSTKSMAAILNELIEYHPVHLQFDSILIDEGQDFNGDWIHFLKQFFTQKGEIMVFYDQAQDIYNHGLWITDSNEIQGIGFRGQPGNLKISHRMPQSIVMQIDILRKILNINQHEEILSANSQQDLFTQIIWKNVSLYENRGKIVHEYIKKILDKGISTKDDITILTMKENTGIEMVHYLTNLSYKTSHVYDLSRERDKGKRRDEKWKFQPGKGNLKICSYQSFKGWESSHIILLLESIGNEQINSEEMKNAIFVALSRVNAFSESRSFLCINNYQEFNWLESHFNRK